MFYSNPSTYLWEDELGGDTTHRTRGGRGALGQHKSLVEAQARLSGNERPLDDICIASMPDRVSEAHTIVEEELSTHAHIHLHHGKTKVWNRGGVESEGIAEVTRRARQVRPDAVVWKGDQQLPPNQQGLRVLGVPIGQTEFVLDFLESKSREHATLFQRIPWVQDTQAAFLLLFMCGSTRANFWLRTVEPELTESFAERHDASVWRCLSNILGTPSAPDGAQVIAIIGLICRRIGALECAQSQKCRPFCQLGGRAEDGEEETPRHCRVDDQASGGWRCPLFPGSPAVQRSGGRGRVGFAFVDRVVSFPSPCRGRTGAQPTTTQLAAESHQTTGDEVRV